MKKHIEYLINTQKWLLIPFYFGLIIAQIIYGYNFFKELIHLIYVSNSVSNEQCMLLILSLVDTVMIANLIKMIITGSYHSFVSKTDPSAPSSGMLKVKMMSSLIGVSAIQLLQSFIDISQISPDNLNKQVLIFSCFTVAALILMLIEYLHDKSHSSSSSDTKHAP